MTRKDYVLIAQAIKSERDKVAAYGELLAGNAALSAVEHTARSVACALSQDNMRFDRERFMRACGFED